MSHKSDGESESLNKAPPDDDSVGPPPKMQRSAGDNRLSHEEREKKLLAEAFVKSIMLDYEEIPKSNGMSVLREVVDLETAQRRDVVIRSLTERFWQSCIDKVNTPNKRFRVCAVGTPGIGKTTSTPILIRMLLKEGHTVVYLVLRKDRNNKWYYEFTPNDMQSTRATITTKVYRQRDGDDAIKSLKKESTYYVVDPGKTKDDCDPDDDWFEAKVIIVASPDECHWGRSEFAKGRGKIRGFFKYFPLWSLKELLDARPILGLALADEEIKQRYRQVGGVPRHVFEDSDFDSILVTQHKAINKLTKEQVLKIAKGKLDAVETMGEDQPKSAVIGYKISESDNGSFEKEEVVIISSLVAEKLYTENIKNLWSTMLDPQVNGWKIFEAYTRALMAKNGERHDFECRPCVGLRQKQPEKAEYAKTRPLKLGGCKEIRLVLDIVKAAIDFPDVLFHSVDQAYELIDFIYRDKHGNFHAFQVTLKASHTADPEKIVKLEKAVGDATKLSLYYLVPGERFMRFVTNPVDPRKVREGGTGVSCDIWHVLIPDPNGSDEEPNNNN